MHLSLNIYECTFTLSQETGMKNSKKHSQNLFKSQFLLKKKWTKNSNSCSFLKPLYWGIINCTSLIQLFNHLFLLFFHSSSRILPYISIVCIAVCVTLGVVLRKCHNMDLLSHWEGNKKPMMNTQGRWKQSTKDIENVYPNIILPNIHHKYDRVISFQSQLWPSDLSQNKIKRCLKLLINMGLPLGWLF